MLIHQTSLTENSRPELPRPKEIFLVKLPERLGLGPSAAVANAGEWDPAVVRVIAVENADVCIGSGELLRMSSRCSNNGDPLTTRCCEAEIFMESGVALRRLGRLVYYGPSTFLNKLRFSMAGAAYGGGLETKGRIFVRSTGKIVIGDNVRINSSPFSNPTGGGERTYFQVLRNGVLRIGDNTCISNVAITCTSSVEIGSHVFLGAGVCIFDTNFHSLNPFQRAYRRYGAVEQVSSQAIRIEDYVFVGYRAIILKGSVIGKNTVIGAGAVVSGRVPENQVWAGNPARFMRELEEYERMPLD